MQTVRPSAEEAPSAMPTCPDTSPGGLSLPVDSEFLNAKPNTVNNVFFTTAKLGHDLLKAKKHREAMCCCRAAYLCKYRTDIRTEPPDVQTTFSDVLFDIGMLHMTTEEFIDKERAMEALHLCVEIRRTNLGTEDARVSDALYRLAYVHATNGDLQYAHELLVESLSILLCEPDTNKLALKATWTALGRVQESLGDFMDAESSLIEASKLS